MEVKTAEKAPLRLQFPSAKSAISKAYSEFSFRPGAVAKLKQAGGENDARKSLS
jgi:hypothetical protein